MPKRVHFVVHGTVQGVGYRFFTRNAAEKHSLTGWCQNTPDGKVVGEAQGGEESLSAFLKALEMGPRHAVVARIDLEDQGVVDGEEEKGFEIRR